jgi:hypothetical protein
MRRRILVVLLALGTVGGYASGFSSLRHHAQCHRAWMEERAAQTCTPCPGSAEAPQAPTPAGPR